jgi:hypothetical protein
MRKNISLQAIVLESQHGYQRQLWKWSFYYAPTKIAEQDAKRYEAKVFVSHYNNLKPSIFQST